MEFATKPLVQDALESSLEGLRSNTQAGRKNEQKQDAIKKITHLQEALALACGTSAQSAPVMSPMDLHALYEYYNEAYQSCKAYTALGQEDSYITEDLMPLLQKDLAAITAIYTAMLGTSRDVQPAPLALLLGLYRQAETQQETNGIEPLDLLFRNVEDNDPVYIRSSQQYKDVRATITDIKKSGNNYQRQELLLKQCNDYLQYKQNKANCTGSDLEKRRIAAVTRLRDQYLIFHERNEALRNYQTDQQIYESFAQAQEQAQLAYSRKLHHCMDENLTKDNMRHILLHAHPPKLIENGCVQLYSLQMLRLVHAGTHALQPHEATLLRRAMIAQFLHLRMEQDRAVTGGRAGALEQQLLDPTLEIKTNSDRLCRMVEQMDQDEQINALLQQQLTRESFNHMLTEDGVQHLSRPFFQLAERPGTGFQVPPPERSARQAGFANQLLH